MYLELMDKDIRAALFDGFDDEGEFEELQDDFVLQVCGAVCCTIWLINTKKYWWDGTCYAQQFR